MTADTTDTVGRPGLGTFGGVFTPSLLTILGVIMYLRLGWVVGNTGLTGTLIIVTIATSITFLTGLSISQIATDQRVKAGGAYYMVSRALGIEVGGAIGLPLYLAQALSVALYTIGFAESLHAIVPSLNPRLTAIVTTLAVAAVALMSARVAIRAQYFIMAAIVISLLSFFFGNDAAPVASEAALGDRAGFWQAFAVFFPAVTGIMAGVNLSGDLEDPRSSIPKGTMAAIGVSYVIYMLIPMVLVARADTADLLTDPLIMRRIAFWGDAILLGVWGATLSSAIGSILGAPRILQALARDRILPRWAEPLGRGSGPDDEPRIGTYLTLALALVAVALGDLNAIAPILTMFFLASYAVVNVVSAVERFLRSPSFRPTFRVHWALSLLGAIGCSGVMFLINPMATVVATGITAGIYFWLQSKGLRTAWGDVRHGVWEALIRTGLQHVRGAAHAKNWRPNFLVLAGSPAKRWYLIDLANAISHDRGILSVATILPEDATPERKAALAETIRDHLEDRSVDALVRVVGAPNPYAGAGLLVEAYGLGSVVPNTVLLGDGANTTDPVAYAAMIRTISAANRSIVVVRADEERGFGSRRTIDVWVQELRGNGSLMLTLAHLLTTSLDWRQSRVRVRKVVNNPDGVAEVEQNLRQIVDSTRIEADVDVVIGNGNPIETIADASAGADLTLIGMAGPGDDPVAYSGYLTELKKRTAGLNAIAFVLAAEDTEFKHILN